jgi:hypothetical protein
MNFKTFVILFFILTLASCASKKDEETVEQNHKVNEANHTR